MSDSDATGRVRPGETPGERLDRNLMELLQELRVAITGVQVLFAFLLVVPFNTGFGELNSLQRHLYLVALLAAGAATILLVAPAAQHRVTFRLQDKRHLVPMANRCALGGLGSLALAMSTALTLVTSVVFAAGAAIACGLLAFAGFALMWGLLPLRRRESASDEPD